MKKQILLILMLLTILSGCYNVTSESDIEDKDDISEEFNLNYSKYLSDENPVVTIRIRNIGTLKLQLFPEVAENTVNNFISYIKEDKYENSTFHRVIKKFMIQGGAVQEPNKAIRGDFNSNDFNNDLLHYRGVISMARTMEKNSATSQFFIVHKDSWHLDGDYAGFGALVEGFDILDIIASAKTSFRDVPLDAIIIESIEIDLKSYIYKEVIYVE